MYIHASEGPLRALAESVGRMAILPRTMLQIMQRQAAGAEGLVLTNEGNVGCDSRQPESRLAQIQSPRPFFPPEIVIIRLVGRCRGAQAPPVRGYARVRVSECASKPFARSPAYPRAGGAEALRAPRSLACGRTFDSVRDPEGGQGDGLALAFGPSRPAAEVVDYDFATLLLHPEGGDVSGFRF